MQLVEAVPEAVERSATRVLVGKAEAVARIAGREPRGRAGRHPELVEHQYRSSAHTA